jgi:hypothetical protein
MRALGLTLLVTACTANLQSDPPGKGHLGVPGARAGALGFDQGSGEPTTQPLPPLSGSDIAALAVANVDGTACGTNSIGDTAFETSCTGNGGLPEYWCADFAMWIWEHNGVNITNLTAAAGSFYVYGQDHGTLSDSPALGDAVVFDYAGDGVADHVAIVTQVKSDGTIETVSGDWNGDNGTEAQFASSSHVVLNTPAYASTVDTVPAPMGMTISGFIAPKQISAADACKGLSDGTYCGGDDVPGDPKTLYECANGTMTVADVCANGCKMEPGTLDDECN